MKPIIAGLPCFWHAQYPREKEQIIIPTCRVCQKQVRVSNLPATCSCGSDDLEDGQVIKLENGLVHEFDEEGNKVCDYNVLPTMDMLFFGIMNGAVGETYAIDLSDGNIILSDSKSKSLVKLGMCIPRLYGEIDVWKSTFTKVSDENYSYRNNLVYLKSASMGNEGKQVYEFTLGYIYEVNDLKILCGVAVDTRDFKPRLGTKVVDSSLDPTNPSHLGVKNEQVHEDFSIANDGTAGSSAS